MIAVEQQPIMCIISYSRCLYCGRRTPHEVCHEHSSELHPEGIALPEGWNTENEEQWYRFEADPETCDDPHCPLWDGHCPERLSQLTDDERYTVWAWRFLGPSVG